MQKRHVLALDQGTTSSRAIIFGADGEPVATAQKEFTQHYPRPGWVEHDPVDIWSSQSGVAVEALERAGITARDLAAVGIANQRETSMLWDRATLEPIANAIVWQDRRTAGVIDRLRADGVGERVKVTTGLELDPYFSATKVAWLLDNVPGARDRAAGGELAFGTVDAWLTARLTHGTVHATDVSNASRTLLFDIHDLTWDPYLLDLFDVPRPVLPTVTPTSSTIATIEHGPLTGVPLTALAGDQQAATFGQACFEPGQVKNTYGTGWFLVVNTGTEPVTSDNRLLTTVAWRLGSDDAPEYALEGSIFTAGAVVQWLRDGLKVIRAAEEVEALAASVPDSGGGRFVPALTGLGAPHWDPYARGTLLGISRGTTAAHIARAALEGIAFQVADVTDALRQDSGLDLAELKVDGGASRNDTLMQEQADLLGITVTRPKVTETTALGAAFLAGLAVGLWRDKAEMAALVEPDKVFEPRSDETERASRRARWTEAVERSKGWDVADG